MKYSNTVEYNISTKLDASGLTKMQAEIQKIELMLQKNANRGLLSSGEVEKARTQLENLGTALTKAFDPSLGTLNLEKLQTSLKGTEFTAEGLSKAFKLAGTEGELAFNNLVGQLGRLDTGLTQSNSALDKMFTTFSNTFRWGLVSSFFSQFMNAIHSSVDYVKELDDSLTQIMLVTDYNRDSMNEFAKSANEAAKAVSMTTTGMTNASLIFAQQGYDLGQSQELATLSAKLANASQQDTATTSDQITAYMNAYGLQDSMEELTQQMDNWALIANISAADVSELAQASQRAASMANTVGVSGEQLAAQIATIESVTREAPEQIGNGLKTLYARFSDISGGGTDEDGVDLGKVTSQLDAIGVQVLDQFGNIRDVGDIMEDLMVVWDDLDQTSKIAAAQSLAGKYQVNRFVSLMDNSDMYKEYLGATGPSAAGTLDQMNQEYAESLAGRTQKLQATLEGIFNNLFSTDDFYAFIDVAQKALEAVDNLTEAMGGGIPILTALSGLFLQLFSKNISQEMVRGYQNNQLNEIRQQNAQNVQATISQLGLQNAPSEASQNIVSYVQQGAANYDSMSESQIKTYNSLLEDQVQAANQAASANKELANKILEVGAAAGIGLGEKDSIFTGDRGEINTSNLLDVLNSAGKEDFSAVNPDDFKEASQEAENLAKSITVAMDTLATFSTNTNANSEELTDLSQKLDLVKDNLIQLHDAGAISDETFNRMSQTVDSAKTSIVEWDGDLDKITDDLLDLGIEATDLASILQGLSSGQIKWDNLDSSIQNAILQLKAAKDLVQNTNNLGLGFLKGIDTQKQIQGLLDIIGAVTRLTSAYMTFQNLGSIWKNEDISKGEKVLQAIMAVGTIVPTVVDSFNKLKNSIPKLIALQNSLTAASAATATAEAGVGISAKLAASGMGVAATAAGALGTVLKFLTGPWGILLTALGAVAGFAWNQYTENIKELKEEALEAFDEAQSKLEEMQALQEKVNNFQTNFETRKSEGEGFEGLADEARDLADALVEAGHASESADIRLAATKAAALGTEEAYQELADTVKTASLQAEMDTNTDTQKAAIAVLDTQKADLDEIAQKQATLRDLKEQLNSLDQEDSRRGVLENRIKELEEFISKNQEAVEAANQLREAQAANVGLQLSQQTSDMVHSSGIDDATKRAGTYSEYAGTYDYDTLNEIYSKNVADWDKYSELEKIDIMLHTLQDDAQIAAVEIEQVLQTNSSIKDMGYAGQGLTADEQRDNITGALENTGLSAEQNLQLMATFDKDATYKEIMDGIAEVQQGLENGEDFDILLKAKFDPEQIAQGVKEAINAYEPTDEDIDADAFKNMANYIQEADSSAFEEGGMLEDVSPEIQNNAEALEDLVEGILRYDDAVSTLNENEEKWRDALSDSADLQDRAEAVADLKETYSDFLDLGTDVSDQFAENADNLDLMAEAAQGDVDAYNELLAAASEDIAVNVYGVDESSAALQQMSDYLQSDAFQDVEVGMAINDDAFYDALNKMSADAGWTAADMEAYLSDIGCSIDPSGFEETANSLVSAADQTGAAEAEALNIHTTTTVESETGQSTDTSEYTNAIATVNEITGTSVLPVTAGNLGTLSGGAQPTPVEIPYSIPSVTYNATPVSRTNVEEKTGYAVQQKAEQGSGAGGVQVKPGSVRKSNSGGTKNRNASSPHSSGGGGGGGKKSCFVAGTLVSIWGGFKSIEQIKKGNIVLSYNKQLGINEYSEVIQTMIHDTIEPIYTLYIKDEQLRVTGIHRFLVTDKITCGIPQWVHAADLHVGQWVLFADGTWHVIHKIEVNIEHQTVYNFEVSGNHNYYVGRNQILAHNKGGGKKGKGGGGGKAKTIEPKEKKEHEKDYYEEVNSQLDKVEKVLSGIEKKQDKLTGDKARANQNKQINLLQKEIVLQKERLKILTSQEKVDVAKKLKETDKEAEKLLKKNKVLSTIPNPIYDEDGMIANYEQMSKAIDDAHNKLIDKYNAAAAAGNEELTKQIQDDISKFDKLGDTTLKNAKRSNEIVTEIEEVNNTIQELNDSIEDIRIDAYKASQEAIDNLKELQEEIAETNSLFRDFNEDSFMNSFSIDDTPYEKLIESVDKLGNTYNVTKEKANDFYQDLIDQKKKEAASTKDEDEREAILNAINFFEERRRNLSDDELQNGLLGISMEDLNRLQGWIDGTNKESNPFGTNISALYEAYDDARKRTLELFKDYRETIQDMRDAIVDIYDEQEDAIDRNIDNYNRLLDNLERIGDTYQLYYGEDSYEQILNLMQQQGNTMQSQLDQLTAAYKHWYEEYKKALEIGDETLIEEIENKMNDAEEAMLDKAKELAEHWVEMFEKAVEANTQSIYDRLFNNKDIDELTSNWELQKDYMQRYKDDIEKTYELDKLRSKYIDLLNDAQGSSLQTQNKIRQQMQEQLKQLQDQATVSEYDVKLANAKLEILQKQIALEDAQRNKNQMQLRRDTQGNYRYVYRANQDNVKAAQDELLNSEYDAYELTKNETISNNDRALTLVQDFLAKRADIFNKYKDDDEARTKALEELSANYSQLLGTLEEDFRDTTNGMYDILTYMVQNATGDTSTSAMEMLNNLFDEEGKFKDDTQVLWADLANVITEMLGNFENTVKDANEEMISQSEILKTKMTGTNGVLTKIGSSANEMETSLNNAANATNNLAIATSNLFESFSSDSVKFQEMLDKLSDYEEQLRKTQDTTSSLSVQLKNAQATIKTQTAKAEAYHTDLTNLQSGKYTFDKKGNVVSKASLEAQKKQSEETKKSSGSSNWSPYSDAYQIWMNGKWGGGGYWYGPYIAAGHTKAQADQVLKLFNSGYGYKWMDTGGYTGTWNSNEGMSDAKNGKLAVLHQKELILNADDTKNILAAVSIIRELSNSMRESLNPNNFKGTMNVSSTYNPLTEQRVEIQATFPNATDADDIREALIGLSDQAYQYAHRNI